MRAPLKIAIAGTGPAGLAAALFLSRAGHKVTMFDQFDAPRPVGAGLMLQESGRAVLADLGVWSELLPLLRPLDRIHGIDAKSGRTVLRVEMKRARIESWGAQRGALFGVLFGAIQGAQISLEMGFRVQSACQKLDEIELISVQGHRAGPFDLVVNALGAFSPLLSREDLRGARSLPFGALFGSIPEFELDARALIQRYRNANVMLGMLPVGRAEAGGPMQSTFFFSVRHDQLAALRAEGIAAFHDKVLGLWPEMSPVIETISGFDQMIMARYVHRTSLVNDTSQVINIGDSAHSTSPQLGQGANMALLDAKALSVAVERANTVSDIQQQYLMLRRSHVSLYQLLSYSLTPFYQSDSRVLAAIRDRLVAGPAQFAPAQWFLARMVSGKLLNPLSALGL